VPPRAAPPDRELERAAQALAAFDPLGALQVIALRQDARALALRGIAMAQLGDSTAARRLLGRAARALVAIDARARARCLAALGEVALAARDLPAAAAALDEAAPALEAAGDRTNALFTRLQRIRCSTWLGDAAGARTALAALALGGASAKLRAVAALVGAEIATRMLHAGEARSHLTSARAAARSAGIPSLLVEVDRARRELEAPVARLANAAGERPIALAEVEAIARENTLVIDACRRHVRRGRATVDLVTRPVLLALATALGVRAPEAATREELVLHAFGARRASDSMRARLRVEIGRLRAALRPLARIEATPRGYALRTPHEVAVLLPPAAGEESALLALLRGGEAWSTSALAAAVGASQRTVQRALLALRESRRVATVGKGRSYRWVAAPSPTFATTLLLPVRPASELRWDA
jgi:hypothetical protein